MMAKADVSGRVSAAIILAAAQRSRARERRSSQRSAAYESGLPGSQVAGFIPDDVFRERVGIEESLAASINEMEAQRAFERRVWTATSPMEYYSERQALARQSHALTARQCGAPAIASVRSAAAQVASEYVNFIFDVEAQTAGYRTSGESLEASMLGCAVAKRFGPFALVRLVSDLLPSVPLPIYATAVGHLPTVWGLFSTEVLVLVRARDGEGWRSAAAARLLPLLQHAARAEVRRLYKRRPGIPARRTAPVQRQREVTLSSPPQLQVVRGSKAGAGEPSRGAEPVARVSVRVSAGEDEGVWAE